MDTRWIFTFLGPVFLLLALWCISTSRKLVPQARGWLLIGLLFSAMAAWLWVSVPSVPAWNSR